MVSQLRLRAIAAGAVTPRSRSAAVPRVAATPAPVPANPVQGSLDGPSETLPSPGPSRAPRPRTTSTHSDVVTRSELAGASSATIRTPDLATTRAALRGIQASIDALRGREVLTCSDENVHEESGPDVVARPQKRARVDAVTESGIIPSQPQGDKRDGRTKIYVGGYEFTRATITRVEITYRCSFYRSQECAAKLVFYASLMDYDFENMVPHTCTPPSRANLNVDGSNKTLIVRQSMQRAVDSLALGDSASPQEIWESVSARFYHREDDMVIRGLSKTQVISRVHRVRAQQFGSDVHGRVELPPLLRVKLTTLNFFQFHHIWTNLKLKTELKVDRVVGWAHPALLSLLRYGNITLFLDGTFRCVPKHFKQCVVAMVCDRGSKLYVPVFYVLAASKTYDAYWNILQYIRDACGENITPAQVVCDFEQALISAVRDWFPETNIVGCFFHFKQAVYRKMGKLYIPVAEANIAMERGVLDMLTVIDRAKIAKQGIAWVRARIRERCAEDGVSYSTTKWNRFWAYFRKTWLDLLPPQFWNVHGLRRDTIARTNNPLERFNGELNSAFGTPHPTLPRFVNTIDEISRRFVRLRDEIARGVAEPPRRETQHNLPQPVQLPDVAEDAEDEEVSDEESEESIGLSGPSDDDDGDDDDDDGDGDYDFDDNGYDYAGDDDAVEDEIRV